MSKTLSGRLQELKNKEKVQLGIPKVVAVACTRQLHYKV